VTTFIVDASVALKWVLQEPGSEAAIELVARESLAAPDLLFIECANVLWRKVRRGQIAPSAAAPALAALEATPIRVTPVQPHAAAALAIAAELGQSAYDSLYLATAIAEHGIMITADEAFARAALAHPVYASAIRVLA
jgi:predicted nucleic acid-binding protein